MAKLFVPFVDNYPAAVEINGHRVVIVSAESDEIIADLELLGGDEIREMELSGAEEEATEALAALAADVHAGVVLTPPGISPSTLIKSLEQDLPWIH